MEQTLILVLMMVALGLSQPVVAQNGIDSVSPQTITKEESVMDKRFERCINSRACSVQERLQIMNDMNDDMRTTLRRMDGGCATADYHDCIDPQSDEVQRWHTVYSRMWKMMKTMEMPVSSSPKGDKK